MTHVSNPNEQPAFAAFLGIKLVHVSPERVVSELVVRSGHSMQDNPNAVSEVRRILLLHLAESCAQGCTPESTSTWSPSVTPSLTGRTVTVLSSCTR